jgi:hypothetical protein
MTQEDLLLPDGYTAPASSGSQYLKIKLKKADDELVLRGIPAMHSLAEKRELGVYRKLHYGWNGRHKGDSSKTFYRPFLCIQEKDRNGMITKSCPACDRMIELVKDLKAKEGEVERQVSELVARGKAKNIPEAGIEKAVAKLREQLAPGLKAAHDVVKAHNLDGKFLMCVMDKKENFGVFSAPYGLVKKYRAEMKKLELLAYPGSEFKISPAGRKGVFFRFTRTGKASATSDTATPIRIQLADGSEILDFHRISDDQLKRASQVLPDLYELMEQDRISEDKIEALVKLDRESGGVCDIDSVDAILDGDQAYLPPAEDWVDDEEPVGHAAPVEAPLTGLVGPPGSSKGFVVGTPTAPSGGVTGPTGDPGSSSGPLPSPELKTDVTTNPDDLWA